MELIERYLQAIGQYLPAETRGDILAELRSELLEQMDARAEEWGRPLDEADVAALLKVYGKPAAIALRYLPQRSLIGPAVFPFYVFTLKRALPLVLIVLFVANGLAIMVGQRGDIAGQIAGAVWGMVPTLFVMWGVITIVFAGIDYARTKPVARAQLEQWDPMKLPPLKPEGVKQKSFNVRLLELGAHILWMAYVLLIPAHPFLILGPGAQVMRTAGVGFAPVWHPFYALLIVMMSVQLVMRIVALRWDQQKWVKPLDVFANAMGVVGVSMLAFARQLLVATDSSVDAQKLQALNYALGLAFRIALVFAVLGLLTEIWKYLRKRVQVRRSVTA